MPRGCDRSDSLGKISLAGIVAFCLFSAVLLSATPQLHERLHRDANSANHLCAVTLLAAGNCEHSPGAPISAAPVARPLLASLPLVGIFFSAARLVGSVLEHAPPAFA